MRLEQRPMCAPVAARFGHSLPPLFGHCRCFLCGYESGLPLPLSDDQPNWIECEVCGLDNELPPGPLPEAVATGRVPTRFF
jgi:hypothetical protein